MIFIEGRWLDSAVRYVMLFSPSQFSKHQPKRGKSILGSFCIIFKWIPIIILAQKRVKVDTDYSIIL